MNKLMDYSERNIEMTRYILGELSERERARLEDEYFADSNLFEELVSAENDLVDSYVLGRLAGAELREFENHYLSTPEHRQKVAFARTLLGNGLQRKQSKSPAVTWRQSVGRFLPSPVALALVLMLTAAGIWLAIREVRLGRELKQMQTAQAELQRQQQTLQQANNELKAELLRQQTTSRPDLTPRVGQAAAVLALSDLIRGNGKANVLPLFDGIANVVLLMESKGGSYTSYDMAIETPKGNVVLRRKELSNWPIAHGQRIMVQLPADSLAPGDYVLRLIGVSGNGHAQDVNAYSFRVTKH